MNRLEDSLFYAAGYHDGVTQRVDYKRTDSHYIEKHEAIHDRIFYGTADGLLHILAVHALHDPSTDLSDSTRASLADFITALTDETRWAHECAATYLGFKDVASDDARRIAYAHMNDEYRRYYGVYEAIIDRDVGSIFAQFALGWALTYFVFGSRRIESVDDWKALGRDVLLGVDGPSQRLHASIATFELLPNFFRTLLQDAHDALTERNVVWPSLDDDDVWFQMYFTDRDQFEAVDRFLIQFALTRVAERNGDDLVRPEFRSLPAVRAPIERYGVRHHFRTSVGSRLENTVVSETQILDLATTADRQRRIGHPLKLEEFDDDALDRMFAMKDFSSQIFTLGGWRRGPRDQEISVLCYKRDDVFGEPQLEFSGQIERSRLRHLFPSLLGKMMQRRISYPIMIVENLCRASYKARSGSWVLGDWVPEFFQLLPFLQAEQTCTSDLPIAPSISLFRYCADDWSTVLRRLRGQLFQIASAPDWRGWRQVDSGYESVPGQQIPPTNKDFIATVLSHPNDRFTHLRITELETYRLYQPLIKSLEDRGSIERTVSATARDEDAKLMRFAIFTVRDLFPVL